ncbi:MAG: extracellular solute-binding protein [Nibricoccus sp.]
MLKRLPILLALVVTLALPFIFRQKQASPLKADETLVVITPHNEALRYEYGRGFGEWYKATTGKTVNVDWRVIGGTSEINRFLEGEYDAAFKLHWTKTLGRIWSAEIQAGYKNSKLPVDASIEAKEARETFLRSNVGCGLDLFFGGGTPDFVKQADDGRLVDSGIISRHPDWFGDDTIPQHFSGERYWDLRGLWIGVVLSNFGIVYNTDSLKRLGVTNELKQWADLADPRLVGEVALADPTKSSSIAKAFENIIQQQMQARLVALTKEQPDTAPEEIEARAVREGWLAGLQLMQLIGANSRYFTDTSQKPPIDVAQGNSAAGICIDFYGRQQDEAIQRRAEKQRLGFVAPLGGTVNSVDPVALFRGAEHREVAIAFMEYVLSMEGQKIWNFRPGTPGGPHRFALRRLPVRRDFYQNADFKKFCSDPEDNPYDVTNQLIYRPAWTGKLFREMSFIIRVITMDTHAELTRAWKAIIAAGRPTEALAVLQDLSAVNLAAANGRIKQALSAKDKTEELKLARELGDHFRAQYRRAEEIAKARQ